MDVKGIRTAGYVGWMWWLAPAIFTGRSFSTKEMTAESREWAAICAQMQHAQGIAT
jgi:hypothetical protein